MNLYNNCDHEDADTRMFNHVYLCAKEGWKKFDIQAEDTDAVVLAVKFVQTLKV